MVIVLVVGFVKSAVIGVVVKVVGVVVTVVGVALGVVGVVGFAVVGFAVVGFAVVGFAVVGTFIQIVGDEQPVTGDVAPIHFNI